MSPPQENGLEWRSTQHNNLQSFEVIIKQDKIKNLCFMKGVN